MIPSFLNVIFGIILLFGVVLNKFSSAVLLTIIVVILILNFLIFIAAFIRKNNNDKTQYFLKEILKNNDSGNIKEGVNENLKLIIDEMSKLKQKFMHSQNNNDFLQSCLNEQAKNLKNINQVLLYTTEENLDYTRELIQKHNDDMVKNIYSITKNTTQYETHYNDFNSDLNPSFEGVKIAVLNDDILENFILENVLRHYNVSVSFFNQVYDFSNYACVIADEKYDYNAKNVIILGDSKSSHIKRPINKIKLKNILSDILKDYKVDVNFKNLYNDMLIFLDSNVASELLLHIAEKHTKSSKKVDSISSFKQELKNNYKMIAIGYNCMTYDYETLKSNISSIKSKNPDTFIMLFLGNKHTNKNLDFVDLIIKDASEAEIMEVIKKHI